MRPILIASLLCLLTACQTTQQSPNTLSQQWVGVPKRTLMNQWGLPTSVTPLKNGGIQYVYMNDQNKPLPHTAPSRNVIVGPQGHTAGFSVPVNGSQRYMIHCVTTFEIGPDALVKSVKQKGAGCS